MVFPDWAELGGELPRLVCRVQLRWCRGGERERAWLTRDVGLITPRATRGGCWSQAVFVRPVGEGVVSGERRSAQEYRCCQLVMCDSRIGPHTIRCTSVTRFYLDFPQSTNAVTARRFSTKEICVRAKAAHIPVVPEAESWTLRYTRS